MSSGMFGLSDRAEDQAHLLSILRDRLYTNKVLAVMREYSTNAWDAHVDAGKADVPIRVRLPTPLDRSFSVRDFGKGLPEQDVFQVYSQYGRSTKRDSDSVAGMLGIGSKSGFAYAPSFTITSYHGGKKMIFSAALDPTNIGKITKLYEGDTEETGIEIKIPVNEKDIPQFRSESPNLYEFFSPRPDINFSLPDLNASLVTESGFASRSGHRNGWFARMGCVTYKLDINQIDAEGVRATGLNPKGAVIFANLGELDVSASREELEYTERTKEKVRQLLRKLGDEQRERLSARVKETYEKGYAGRLDAVNIRAESAVTSLPAEVTRQCATSVSLWDWGEYELFQCLSPHKKGKYYTYERNVQIPVERNFRLIIQDTKSASGVSLERCRVIRPLSPSETVSEVEDLLQETLKAKNLQGVPIVKMSALLGSVVAEKRKSKPAPQIYKEKLVVWRQNTTSGGADAWLPAPRSIEQQDVYVHVYRFQAEPDLKLIYTSMRHLGTLGVAQPPVFGIRRGNLLEQIRKTGVEPTHFSLWEADRKTELRKDPTNLSDYKILLAHSEVRYSASSYKCLAVEQALGADHPVSQLVRLRSYGHKLSGERKAALLYLYENTDIKSDLSYPVLREKYPLLPQDWEFLEALGTERFAHIARYIQLIDLYGG